jgi:hypothetical protein
MHPQHEYVKTFFTYTTLRPHKGGGYSTSTYGLGITHLETIGGQFGGNLIFYLDKFENALATYSRRNGITYFPFPRLLHRKMLKNRK